MSLFRVIIRSILLLLSGALAFLPVACARDAPHTDTEEEWLLQRAVEARTIDLDAVLAERKSLRVLVSYDRMNFFIDQGRLRGLEYELLHEYQAYLTRDARHSRLRPRVVFLVVPFNRLLSDLRAGKGDIAAAGLTITPDRSAVVAFTDPYITNVREIVVASRSSRPLDTLADLSGRTVHVLSGSSHVRHLQEVNRELKRKRMRPVTVVQADPSLQPEDILEMVNAGIYDLTVTDHHIAEAWAKVLPDIVPEPGVVIHEGGAIAWAVRKDNPQLRGSLNGFLKEHRQGTLLGNLLLNRYYHDTRWIADPLSPRSARKLAELIGLFRKYADRYGFDWYKVAALAYQESGFDQRKRSPAGAVGIMQVRPSTASASYIGIPDISSEENNIHAGVKYLSVLRDRYFNDPALGPAAQFDFIAAAYNAGPARIAALRKKARELGLDPNSWFQNVEYVARREIGRETVRYVANVNKYYLAYRSSLAVMEKRSEEREKYLAPTLLRAVPAEGK